MNTFCMKDCTGNCVPEIYGCKDKYCPFYRFRFADIKHEDDEEISVKLKGIKDEE